MSNEYSKGFQWEIEKLLQRRASPDSGLSDSEERKLNAQYAIIERNFYELAEFIDGGITTHPYVESARQQSHIKTAQFEHYRLLHNYLASVYSYIEHIHVLVNRKTAPETQLRRADFYSSTELKRSHFSWQLTFLIGLRTACQHSDFPGLGFELQDNDPENSLVRFYMVFKRHEFVQTDTLRDTESFLPNLNDNQSKYPVIFLAKFHKNHFQHFDDDMREWFDSI